MHNIVPVVILNFLFTPKTADVYSVCIVAVHTKNHVRAEWVHAFRNNESIISKWCFHMLRHFNTKCCCTKTERVQPQKVFSKILNGNKFIFISWQRMNPYAKYTHCWHRKHGNGVSALRTDRFARIVFSEMDKYNTRDRALALWHKDRDMKIRSNVDPLMMTTTTTKQKQKRGDNGDNNYHLFTQSLKMCVQL